MRGKIYQFLVMVNEIEPVIWRRILVPRDYSFWDLHVAIQDSMGWEDCHQHLFVLPRSGAEIAIGIPGDRGLEGGARALPGWDTPIAAYFQRPGAVCDYVYDFGDRWEHRVVLEDALRAEEGQRYPACVDGARACPPEDCGGVFGYSHLVEVLSDPGHAEHAEIVGFLGRRYDPEAFSPEKVRFDDPRERWRQAFAENR